MREPRSSSFLMLAAGLVLPLLVAKGARALAGGGYRRIADREPPQNPASRETGWVEAIVWTALVGALGGVSRMLTRRALSETVIPSEGDDLKDEADDFDGDLV